MYDVVAKFIQKRVGTREFADAIFPETTSCDVVEYGDKKMCRLPPRCTVWSLGSNNQLDFEKAVLEKTSCEVLVFDCTTYVDLVHERFRFFPLCFGDYEVQSKMFPFVDKPPEWGTVKLDPTRFVPFIPQKIDALKMDVEGAEYGVVRDMMMRGVYPKQIAFESHWWTRDVAHAVLSTEMFHALRQIGYKRVTVTPQDDDSCFEWLITL